MFSIIIPCFNSQRYILKSLETVIVQDHLDQIIIQDGGSHDKTLQLIAKFQNNKIILNSEKDTGQQKAINKGLYIAKGEIINWLNSDDYYEPEALKIVSKYSNKDTFVVAGRSRVFDENGTKYITKGTDIYWGNLPKTLGWARIDQPETFFRRNVWEKVGPLNEDLHYVFDREWWIRYLLHFGFVGFRKIPDVLVNFRHHKDSKTVMHKNEFIKENRQIYAAYAKHFGETRIQEIILGSEEINETIDLEIPEKASADIIRSMLHYHLLLLGNEYYAENKNIKAKTMLDAVNEEYLNKADMRLLQKLKFRNKIPTPLKKVARQFRA